MLNSKTTYRSVYLIGFLALILVIYLYYESPEEGRQIVLNFSPKEMNSCPGHTAWFLVNITGVLEGEIPGISIKTDHPVKHDYVLWDNVKPEVLEVFVYPNSSHVDSDIKIAVEVDVGSSSYLDFALLHIVEWDVVDLNYTFEFRDVFVDYFENSHPDFMIDNNVTWSTTLNAPKILVVEHYLFMSDGWEMELSRHVMVPPYDWVKVYLRPRDEIKPVWAGKIESWSNDKQLIMEVDPPNQIYR